MKRLNIAIDGPAGAGKSTVARAVADALGILYLDTGAMYRAVAWYANHRGVESTNAVDVAEILSDFDLHLDFSSEGLRVSVCGQDVTTAIREPIIARATSDVAAQPLVRQNLVAKQRKIAQAQDCVLDGRDIGSHVLPDAPIKIFLTASLEERARRRAEELLERGMPQPLEAVMKDIAYRDQQDSSRACSPLKKMPDAHEINTSELSIEQVRDEILSYVKEYGYVQS